MESYDDASPRTRVNAGYPHSNRAGRLSTELSFVLTYQTELFDSNHTPCERAGRPLATGRVCALDSQHRCTA